MGWFTEAALQCNETYSRRTLEPVRGVRVSSARTACAPSGATGRLGTWARSGQGAQPGHKRRQADGSKSTVAASLFQIGRRAPGGGPAASESMPNTGHSCTLNSLRATDRARKRRVGWRGGGGKFRLPIPAAEARSARHYWVSPAVWRAATAPDRRARRAAASPRRGRVSRPERPGWIVPRPLTSADRLAGRTLAWRASA